MIYARLLKISWKKFSNLDKYSVTPNVFTKGILLYHSHITYILLHIFLYYKNTWIYG